MRPHEPSNRLLAGIDIGANTVRLLVIEVQADGVWRIADESRRITRLGEGAHSTGVLQPAAIERTLAALAEFAERARRAGAERLFAVATSAVREAANQQEFLQAAAQRCQVDVQVIDAQEEARLTLAGVQRGVGCVEGESLIFDIGGGSTEFTLARGEQTVASVSCRLGVVTLTERYLKRAPVVANEFAELAAAIDADLDAVERRVKQQGAAALIGTAGTITTLSAIDQGMIDYDPPRINGARLDLPRVRQLTEWLAGMSLEERGAVPGLEPGREDIIIGGAAIVVRVMERFGFAQLVVSDYGLREGLICALQRQAAS